VRNLTRDSLWRQVDKNKDQLSLTNPCYTLHHGERAANTYGERSV